MKTNKIRSHLVTLVPKAPFTPISTSKLRSALHFRYSIVIPHFISRANTFSFEIAVNFQNRKFLKNSNWNMRQTPSKMRMNDMVMIDTTVCEIVGRGF